MLNLIVYANSVGKLVTHKIKGDFANRKTCMHSFTHKLVLNLERWQYSDKYLSYHHFRLLHAILDIWHTIVSLNVRRCRVHTARFVHVAPFWRWNDVSIFSNCEVISTSGFRLPSWILDTRWYTSTIVLKSAVNKKTFEMLHNALMVTKMQVCRGCVSCR